METTIKLAQKKFECYEVAYLGISGNRRKYLQIQSRAYKRSILDVQEIILPSIKRICPTCDINCCKLYTPELSICIEGCVGGFNFVDYILVRCDTILPDPCFKNMEKNLCPFWADGCILPIDCRSFLCIQYFCDKLQKELDMQVISKHLEILESIQNNFSIQKCLGLT